MADEAKVAEVIQAPEVPKAPEAFDRDKLTAALDAEKKARGQRVMQQIESLCKANNCLFVATAILEESPSGGFVVKAYPGVKPL
jgi:phage terminase large subunit-like protein